MQAVDGVISELFPEARVVRLPSHQAMSKSSHYVLKRSDYCFVGGTNILASKGWQLHWHDLVYLNRAICLGVTWGGTKATPTYKERLILRRVLDGQHQHSVRDQYTKKLLDGMNIRSVSTSCPAMWKLTPEHCEAIPKTKSDSVMFTLTGYRSDLARDRQMIETLQRNYRNLYFFPQMVGDMEYLESLQIGNVKIIPPNLRAYDEALANTELDYVGSRLHGGIRALQFKKRTLIIGIDHRSRTISQDTGLPVLDRVELNRLESWITNCAPTRIRIPLADIAAWKSQVLTH